MYWHDNILHERLKRYSFTFHQVVDFNPGKENVIHFDFTNHNRELDDIDIADTKAFSAYVKNKLQYANAKYGIGGYNELRHLYERSKVFDAVHGDEPRRLHLGIDIWGESGTKVYAPLAGKVHSYGYNNKFGDYGATIVLQHQLDTISFHTLYGHLSLDDIARITEYQFIERGQLVGCFGKPEENGNWPPHLHFQVIREMEEYVGDYPGVCRYSEHEKYLANCPDPELILNMAQYVSVISRQ